MKDMKFIFALYWRLIVIPELSFLSTLVEYTYTILLLAWKVAKNRLTNQLLAVSYAYFCYTEDWFFYYGI